MAGQMHVPALVVVVDQLGLNRELHQQCVQPSDGVLRVAGRRGGEDGSELGTQVFEHGEIAPGDRDGDAVPEGLLARGGAIERVRLAISLSGSIGKADRKLCVGRQVHYGPYLHKVLRGAASRFTSMAQATDAGCGSSSHNRALLPLWPITVQLSSPVAGAI